jgi:drug/metabolite transporter (DMT)-like permease
VRVGFALLVFSALTFSLHNMLARLAYDEGVTPTTVNAVRTWAVAIMFVLYLGVARGEWPSVPRPARRAFALTALCYIIHNPALLLAFKFVPVGLAVVVMYVYPIAIAFLAAAIGLEKLRGYRVAAAIVAFAGVALVIGVGEGAVNWRGVALAFVAALALSGNVVGAAVLNRHMGPLGVPFALSCVGVVVFAALMLADGGPALPATARGWWIFAAATLASPAALIGFYIALPRAGAQRSGLILNVEPVFTVFLAMLILGETLGAYQALGAALIVGAIAAASVMDLKRRQL